MLWTTAQVADPGSDVSWVVTNRLPSEAPYEVFKSLEEMRKTYTTSSEQTALS